MPAGTIKSLRVVALEFRSAGIRSNHSGGPGGGALISTPVAIGNGTWDVKRVLGETPVHEDGSAFFVVPARTPVYFQMLDDRGRTVQTMRSWSTLQPGENASCIGCHESPNSAPPALDRNTTLALRKPPQPLKPPQDPPRGFSFNREVQPVLDRHCVSCHNHREPVLAMAAGERPAVLRQPPEKRSLQRNQAFSLRKDTVDDPAAGRAWSDAYLVLTNATREGGPGGTGPFRGDPDGKVVNWISSQSVPTPLPPNTAGSTRSTLLELLGNDHYGVRLNQREQAAIACWIDLLVPFGGDYAEGNIWTEAEMAKFLRFEEKRRRLDAEDKQVAEELKNR